MAYVSKFWLAASCASAALVSSAAAAEEQEPATEWNQEIVVTASKRSETLHDVPSSVTAVTGLSLQKIAASTLDDYVARIPSLTVARVSMIGSTQLSIRGVTTGPGGNPTVGIYIDDSPFGASNGTGGFNVPDLDPQDLQRVEVLRGPQGTLYGAGGMGGLLKYVTAEPDPTRFYGRASVDGSATYGGGEGYGVRAALNIPISEDLALRVSGYHRQDPGYIDNVLTGLQNVNELRAYGGRAALGWQVSDDWKVRLSSLYQHQKGAATIVDFNSVTFQPQFGDLKQNEAFGTNVYTQELGAHSLSIEGDLGDFATLTSATSFNHIKTDFTLNFTPVFGPLATALFGIPNAGVAINNGPARTHKFSQEVRLASPLENKLAWQIGVFYTEERTKGLTSTSIFDQTDGTPFPAAPQITTSSSRSAFEEVAVFGDITYHFSPAFDVTAGVRYSKNNQHSVGSQSSFFTGGVVTTRDLRFKDDATTYLINPRFHLSDDTMIYARFATGYRPGGANSGLFGTPPSYIPDTVTNYEVGLKTELFDKRVAFDVAAYWIDWTNIQVQQSDPVTATSFVGNGPKAVSKGVEASGSWTPTKGLQFFGNIAYQDAQVTKDFPVGGVIARDGDRLPLTPRWSGQLGWDYTFPLAAAWNANLGGDWRHVGRTQGGFPNPGQARFFHPAYDVFNLRAVVSNDRLSIGLYLKNIGNDFGQTADVNFGALTRVSVIQPRTVQLAVSTTF